VSAQFLNTAARGLNRNLHEAALALALREHRFAFLFSDEDAMPFYARVGFVRVADHAQFVRLAGTAPHGGLEKIDLGSKPELDALYELACARAPISEVLANFNPKLVVYHAIYTLRAHAWRIPALGATVFMKRSWAKTVVYDVLARDLPDFDSLYPYLSSGTAEEFEFRFPTDRLGLAGAGVERGEKQRTRDRSRRTRSLGVPLHGARLIAAAGGQDRAVAPLVSLRCLENLGCVIGEA
jgi:hypothetical protein